MPLSCPWAVFYRLRDDWHTKINLMFFFRKPHCFCWSYLDLSVHSKSEDVMMFFVWSFVSFEHISMVLENVPQVIAGRKICHSRKFFKSFKWSLIEHHKRIENICNYHDYHQFYFIVMNRSSSIRASKSSARWTRLGLLCLLAAACSIDIAPEKVKYLGIFIRTVFSLKWEQNGNTILHQHVQY